MSHSKVTQGQRRMMDVLPCEDFESEGVISDQINPVIFQPGEGVAKLLERLIVICWNIRGLSEGSARSSEKVALLSRLVEELGAHVIFLQETHMGRQASAFLNKELDQFVWFSSPGSGSSWGTAIGIRKRALMGEKVNIIDRDRSGRWVIVEASIYGCNVNFASIYIPSLISEFTLDAVSCKLNKLDRKNTVLGGDFNIDTLKVNGAKLFTWCDANELSLVENGHPTFGGKSIIDHFAVGSQFDNYNCALEVRVGNGLDHSILVMKLVKSDTKKVRFPNVRLDPVICRSALVHREALLRTGDYIDRDPLDYLREFGENVRVIVSTNVKLIGDEELQKSLCNLVACLGTNRPEEVPSASSDDHFVRDIITRYEGAHFPSGRAARRRWKALVRMAINDFRNNFGVKVSHLFPSKVKLPKWKFRKKYKLLGADGGAIENEMDAEKYLGEFWKGILGVERTFNSDLLEKLLAEHPTLYGCEKERYEVNISKLRKLFKHINETSAGYDGLPFSLFVSSFELLEKVWIDLLEGIGNGEANVPEDFGCSLLSLIAKAEGSIEAKDFRPISVTNVIYRIVMKFFAKELRRVAEPLVAPPQRALLKGRTIISATRRIIDTWYNRLWREEKSIFLKTDFSKAFDFFNRDALLHILAYYNIPSHLVNVAKIALRNSTSHILGYGDGVSFCSVTGVRQGCPISPLLYILGVDLLTRGLMKVDGIVAMGCYADDNGVIVDSVKSLSLVKKVIEVYCDATGAELNIKKCVIMSNFKVTTPKSWSGITSSNASVYLGIPICVEPSEDAIWGEIRRKVSAAAFEIKKLKISFNQKIMMVNTYLIPITQYIGSCYLMGKSTSAYIWSQIRRCLGIKVAISNLGLTCDGPVSLTHRIRDPFVANVASLIAGVPRSIGEGPISPFSTVAQRLQALKIFELSVKNLNNHKYLMQCLCNVDRYKELVCAVGRAKLPRLIYNLINGLDPPTVPTHILSPLGLDRYRDVGIMMRNLALAGNFYGRNALILLLHKSWAVGSKLNILKVKEISKCMFCSCEELSHLHLISKCSLSEWIFSIKERSSLWPGSVGDLLLTERNLSRDEVKVRLAILAALAKVVNECKNFQEAICLIEKEVGNVPLTCEFHSSDEKKVSPESEPPVGRYPHKLYFDGSACPELRNGGFGYSICHNMGEIVCLGGMMGNATVNDAELFALYMGLKRARERGIDELSVFGDSKLVVGLGTKGAHCFNAKFLPIFLEIQRLISEFRGYDIQHIPRRYNSRADVLAYTGCNAPSMLKDVMVCFNHPRPKRDAFRPHSYVVPSVNRAVIWHQRTWNPMPLKSHQLNMNKVVLMHRSALESYRSFGGL
jgi:ribonuclease HI